MNFDLYLGIDYSGAETAESRLRTLQVYAAKPGSTAEKVHSCSATDKFYRNWSRKDIAAWIIERAKSGEKIIAGIDHCFSFPLSYFQRYKLSSWEEFLQDFSRHWTTHHPHTYVDFLLQEPPDRMGDPGDLRLTESWTQGAKTVFKFHGIGAVGKSSFAGIPWLKIIREQAGRFVHFWPFDGWDFPAGKSVILEVYPALFKKRYTRENRTGDEHDAFCVANWLKDMDAREALERYCHPPLTDPEKHLAALEGWIFGVC